MRGQQREDPGRVQRRVPDPSAVPRLGLDQLASVVEDARQPLVADGAQQAVERLGLIVRPALLPALAELAQAQAAGGAHPSHIPGLAAPWPPR